jgi:hypothetical protein
VFKAFGSNPNAYLSDVAMTLHNLAILELTQDHVKQAQVLVSEALTIRRSLYKQHAMAHGRVYQKKVSGQARR